MLVCGILKGLNVSLTKKVKKGNINQVDISKFDGFEVLDPELIAGVKLGTIDTQNFLSRQPSFVSNYLE